MIGKAKDFSRAAIELSEALDEYIKELVDRAKEEAIPLLDLDLSAGKETLVILQEGGKVALGEVEERDGEIIIAALDPETRFVQVGEVRLGELGILEKAAIAERLEKILLERGIRP